MNFLNVCSCSINVVHLRLCPRGWTVQLRDSPFQAWSDLSWSFTWAKPPHRNAYYCILLLLLIGCLYWTKVITTTLTLSVVNLLFNTLKKTYGKVQHYSRMPFIIISYVLPLPVFLVKRSLLCVCVCLITACTKGVTANTTHTINKVRASGRDSRNITVLTRIRDNFFFPP